MTICVISIARFTPPLTDRSLAEVAGRNAPRSLGETLTMFVSHNAGEGIRTLEPLQERILSPPLLARLSHPRAGLGTGGGVKPLSDAIATGSAVHSVARSYQSTESVPSPCGSGAISLSVRRSTTWITPASFFAGHTSAARTFSSSSSSLM